MSEHLRALALAAKNATCFDDFQDAIYAMDHMTTPDAVLALLDDVDRLKAEIADHERAYELLFKENAELRKDAERLDYLQNNARCDPKMDGNHVWWPTSFNQAQSLKGPTIRAAIDSAAKGESNE
jgi:deoxyadenosine/deoxycytidine kinase